MMLVERILVLTTTLLTILAGVGWFTSAPRRAPPPRSSVNAVRDIGVPTAESIDAAAGVVAQTDPFRLDRRPTSVPYRPDLEGVVPPPKPAKPVLVLEGVVGNVALLDGAPGHGETAIVHVGDTLGGLRVRRIGRDTVLISGADTTWRLTLRQAWP
jgi:hypothetical protein